MRSRGTPIPRLMIVSRKTLSGSGTWDDFERWLACSACLGLARVIAGNRSEILTVEDVDMLLSDRFGTDSRTIPRVGAGTKSFGTHLAGHSLDTADSFGIPLRNVGEMRKLSPPERESRRRSYRQLRKRPQPIQAAASKAESASALGIGMRFASAADPVRTEMNPPAWMIRSKELRSTTRSLRTGKTLTQTARCESRHRL